MRKLTMTRKRSVFLLTAAVAISALMAGAAVATPATGIVSGTVMARASFVDTVDLKLKVSPLGTPTGGLWTSRASRGSEKEVIQVSGARETVMQQIVIGPGGQTGWHTHPGPVVVLVKAGELTFVSNENGQCSSRTYSAGQAFIDSGQGHVHVARNPSLTQNTDLWVTYFDVPVGQAFRLDAADPGTCSF